jgi:CheY-like chemotaxis protein
MPRGGNLTLSAEEVAVDEQHASMHPHARRGRYVVYRVTDTGSGIAPSVRDRIFEPFFTTKELGKGTGLGLSTAMAIVRSHGGFMNVQSEPGSPTTFSAYLPADGQPCVEEAPRPPTAPRGKGELVLLVDDEESIRTIGKRTLEAAGYRVITAADGAEAVAEFAMQRDRVALVLTDMGMPVMDGTTTARALQRIRPEVRIIVASGYGDENARTRARDAGVRHVLAKPYSGEALLCLVRRALDEAPERR